MSAKKERGGVSSHRQGGSSSNRHRHKRTSGSQRVVRSTGIQGLVPLQRPQGPGTAICMAASQDGRACTFGACYVYREIAGLLNAREARRRRGDELELAIAAEREKLGQGEAGEAQGKDAQPA